MSKAADGNNALASLKALVTDSRVVLVDRNSKTTKLLDKN